MADTTGPVAITLSAIAGEARSYFEKAKRPDGAEYYRTKDNTPIWIGSGSGSLVYRAHNDGNMLPDDWRYEAIYHVLGVIEDSGEATRDDLEANAGADELLDYLVDGYNSELSKWLASSVHRGGYVDEAIDETGAPEPFDIWRALQMGQLQEYREIFNACLEVLEEARAQRIDDGE